MTTETDEITMMRLVKHLSPRAYIDAISGSWPNGTTAACVIDTGRDLVTRGHLTCDPLRVSDDKMQLHWFLTHQGAAFLKDEPRFTIETAFAHIEAHRAGGDELGIVSDEDWADALQSLRIHFARLQAQVAG